MSDCIRCARTLVASIAFLTVATAVAAQDAEKTTGWFDTAELGLVSTSGNSNSTTLGFNNLLRHVWTDAEFAFELGVVRSEIAGDRFGVGTLDNFAVEDAPRKVDTERYFGKANYGRNINPKFFWYLGADGERNVPANIDHRATGTGGVGNTWFDDDKHTFRTSYGINYTDEKLTLEGTNTFSGLRLGYLYKNLLTPATTFDSDLTFDTDFEESENYRSDWFNAVTVSVASQVALKVSLRLLYRNLPALAEIEIFDSEGGTSLGMSVTENEKLDSNFGTSLVVTF